MHPYDTSSPRAGFAIAAIAMTAMTIGLTVVVPAKMDSGRDEARTLARPAATILATPAAVTSRRQ